MGGKESGGGSLSTTNYLASPILYALDTSTMPQVVTTKNVPDDKINNPPNPTTNSEPML